MSRYRYYDELKLTTITGEYDLSIRVFAKNSDKKSVISFVSRFIVTHIYICYNVINSAEIKIDEKYVRL